MYTIYIVKNVKTNVWKFGKNTKISFVFFIQQCYRYSKLISFILENEFSQFNVLAIYCQNSHFVLSFYGQIHPTKTILTIHFVLSM